MQNALIVDDSKLARVTLSKMLDKYSIGVDMVESGEQALEYLRTNTPQIIFMDHMMPGMDGFQAVKAIKADPEKAHIPIVMHTTRVNEGELYLGQAKALGPADILPKPATDDHLKGLLERLKDPSPVVPADLTPLYMQAVTSEQAAGSEESFLNTTAEHVAVEMSSKIESEQRSNSTTQSETKADTTAVYKIDTSQLPKTTNSNVIPVASEALKLDVEASSRSKSIRQSLSALILVAPIILLLALYIPVERQRSELIEQQRALYGSIEWAANQSGEYDYGEPPMSGRRLEVLQGLLSQLSAAKFKGVIRIEGHVGEFCLVNVALANGVSAKILPSVDMPLAECDGIGFSAAKAVEESGRQSAEFKNFMATSPILIGQDIKVEVVQYGSSSPAYDYPTDIQDITAGDWNAVALANNRVRFAIAPRP